MIQQKLQHPLSVATSLLGRGCASPPEGIERNSDSDLNAYLGKWYEIGKLDHQFERDLQQVSAEFRLRDSSGIGVISRGYSTKTQSWQEIEGKAFPARGTNDGFPKVLFFCTFYLGCFEFELGPGGHYAFVSGSNTNYLWLLARTPT